MERSGAWKGQDSGFSWQKKKSSGPSHRVLRFERELREVVSRFVVHDLRNDLPLLTSVTRVQMPADLRTARVFIHVEGGKQVSEKALEVLEHSRVEIQTQVARSVGSRFTPKIEFIEDRSFEKVLSVEKTLRELNLHK